MSKDPQYSPLYPGNYSAKRQRNQSYSEGAQYDPSNQHDQQHEQNADPNMRPRSGSATYRSFNPNYKGNNFNPYHVSKKATGGNVVNDTRNTQPRGPPQTKSVAPPKLMQAPVYQNPAPVLDPRAELQNSLSWAKVGIDIQLQSLGIDKESPKWTKAVEPICVYAGQSLVKLGLKATMKEETKPPVPPASAFVSDEEFYAKLQEENEPASSSWNMF